ncbi:reverse transcriptase domain-containing protein [Tanacetum coccineum]
MIRNWQLILSKWTPYTSLTKNEVTKVPVWIKLHEIPLVAYSEDGLSLIATQVGKPIMLDAFTSQMCSESWGRIGYARALVEISAMTELKTEVTMAVPVEDGEGYTREVISDEYEWKPPQCTACKVFGHSRDTCPKRDRETETNSAAMDKQDDGFTEVTNRKNKGKKAVYQPNSRHISGVRLTPKPKPSFYRPKQAPESAQGKSDLLKPTSNPFDALNHLGEEDNNGIQDPTSTRETNHGVGNGIKDPNVGVYSSVKKKNLVFSTQTKIHYFDSDDTDTADMDHVFMVDHGHG